MMRASGAAGDRTIGAVISGKKAGGGTKRKASSTRETTVRRGRWKQMTKRSEGPSLPRSVSSGALVDPCYRYYWHI